MRLFERAMRRAGLPLKLSEGFNPRPQVSFPVALALGVESVAELFEAELTHWVSTTRAKVAVEREMPRGISISSVQSVGYGEKANVVACEYSVKMGVVPAEFAARLRGFLDARSAVVTRETKAGAKRIDVRNFVRRAQLDGDILRLDLSMSPAGSVRPEEVLEAVLQGPAEALAPLAITRTRLDLSSPP